MPDADPASPPPAARFSPYTLAGELTVRELNGYVDAEFTRLTALGFIAGEDFNANTPADDTEVRWSVMVRVRASLPRIAVPSIQVVGRNEDGTPKRIFPLHPKAVR